MKIGHAVLAICLNLGTPQGLRTKTEEAFFDPSTRHHERSMRKIMANLIDSIEGVQKMNILAVRTAVSWYLAQRLLFSRLPDIYSCPIPDTRL